MCTSWQQEFMKKGPQSLADCYQGDRKTLSSSAVNIYPITLIVSEYHV